jgi:hypothetical protein
MRRKAIHVLAVSFAGVAIMLAAEGGASARSAGAIASSHPQPGKQLGGQSSPVATQASSRGNGWGYGRGWCYWHPYACYRAQ